MSLKERIRVVIGKRRPVETSLVHDDVGFTLQVDSAAGNNSAHHFEWREIRRVVADARGLRFETPDRSLDVTAAADGWDAFVASLSARLPGCRTGEFPGDATAETVLFERPCRT